MKPAWDQLGEKYQDSSSVVVADVDCTQHQQLCQQHSIRGYPTIKYYKAGSKTPEDYRGARSFEALDEFVKNNLA